MGRNIARRESFMRALVYSRLKCGKVVVCYPMVRRCWWLDALTRYNSGRCIVFFFGGELLFVVL